MSEISRRNFLKTGALTLGGPVLGKLAGGIVPSHAASAVYPDPDRELASCCQFCQVRCTTKVEVRNGRVFNVSGNPENFWTGGAMCPKGQSLVELTNSPDRILYPLVRDGGGWKRISYAEAVDLVGRSILAVKQNFPEDFAHRVVLFMPLWESRESELAALMALRMAGFPDAATPGDACIASAATVLRICLGTMNSTTTLDQALNAQTLVLWGANIAEIYPPYMRWILAAKEKGVHIVYLDPRKTPTSNFCDLHLMPRPGTDGAVALGVLHVLLKEGLFDRDYVASAVNGFDELEKAVEAYTPERVAEISWLKPGEVVRLATLLGKSNHTMFWLGGSLCRYTNGIQTVRNIIAMQAVTNNLHGTGKGVMNVQGGKPGGEERFLEHYSAPDLEAGLSIRKILYNMKRGKVDVLLLNSTYRRYPDANATKEAISKVGFVVYRGHFMNEEAELAHLIIPGTMPFESDGSQYGAQRQVVWRSKAVEKPGETSEDWKFYIDLGRRLLPDRFPAIKSAEDLYELVRQSDESWKGITLERLKTSPTGVTWPCFSAEDSESRGSIFRDGRFLTEDGKVHLSFKPLGPIRWEEPEGSPMNKSSEEYGKFPLIFLQGKVVHQWQHTYTNWSSYMAQFSEGNLVQIHPETVRDLGVGDGDWVYIETKIGKLKAKVKLSGGILPGVVWTPSHPTPKSPVPGNQGVSINTIIPSYWDKVSAQFNGFGCRLVKAG
ncbi:MAG: molybdopterin-dependent oxidoreductase [Deltaproteobacteria bacterium]|nr:molybdopterin-dependent oxidoreductase [Deltaproteobacteria bacterium]